MIVDEGDYFVLKLDSSVYDIESAREAFRELEKFARARIDCCKQDGKHITIKIKKSQNARKYGYEFLNYLLKLMKNRGIA